MAHWQHCQPFIEHLESTFGREVNLCRRDLDPEVIREYRIEERWGAWLDGRRSNTEIATRELDWISEREQVVWELLDRQHTLRPIPIMEAGTSHAAPEVTGLYQAHHDSSVWVVSARTWGWLLRNYRDRIERENEKWKLKRRFTGFFLIPDHLHKTACFQYPEVEADEILAYGFRGYQRFVEITGAGELAPPQQGIPR